LWNEKNFKTRWAILRSASVTMIFNQTTFFHLFRKHKPLHYLEKSSKKAFFSDNIDFRNITFWVFIRTTFDGATSKKPDALCGRCVGQLNNVNAVRYAMLKTKRSEISLVRSGNLSIKAVLHHSLLSEKLPVMFGKGRLIIGALLFAFICCWFYRSSNIHLFKIKFWLDFLASSLFSTQIVFLWN